MTSGRRNTELGLLVMVVIITAAAYVLASLGRDATIPVNVVPFIVVLLGLLLLGNLVNRKLVPEADPILFPVVALLNGLGYVMIARLDEDLAGYQAMWTAIAMAAYVGTLLLVRKARDLAHYRYTAMLIGLALLVLPMIPGLGDRQRAEELGSLIWVKVGPINFQPGEFAKVALAIFFAGYLYDKRELLAANTRKIGPIQLPEPKYLAPLALAWGASLFIMITQRDLGSSLLFFALFVVLIWVATGRASYLVTGVGLFSLGAWFAWNAFDHVQRRVTTWIDPWQDPWDSGYQIIQSAFALAAGGLGGTGLGQSGKHDTWFAAETDFIFVFIAEELGLFGATLVLAAFLLVFGSALRIAAQSEYPFDKLLATGLATLLGLQAFLIMAGVTRLLPLTGVTLPFVSYGGSSLLANYLIVALLLRISDESIRTPAVQRRLERAKRAKADAELATRQAKADAKAAKKAGKGGRRSKAASS